MNESGLRSGLLLAVPLVVLAWVADEMWTGLLALATLLALVLTALGPSNANGTAAITACEVVGIAGLLAAAVALFALRSQRIVGAAVVVLALAVEIVTAVLFFKP